jgi:hypothetical protein
VLGLSLSQLLVASAAGMVGGLLGAFIPFVVRGLQRPKRPGRSVLERVDRLERMVFRVSQPEVERITQPGPSMPESQAAESVPAQAHAALQPHTPSLRPVTDVGSIGSRGLSSALGAETKAEDIGTRAQPLAVDYEGGIVRASRSLSPVALLIQYSNHASLYINPEVDIDHLAKAKWADVFDFGSGEAYRRYRTTVPAEVAWDSASATGRVVKRGSVEMTT